jgi:glyoxylase I family protein
LEIDGLRTKHVGALIDWYKEDLGNSMEDWIGIEFTPQSGNEKVFSFFTAEDHYFQKSSQ